MARPSALLLAALVVAAPVAALASGTSEGALDHVVHLRVADARARGLPVVDDHGAFVTARLTPAQADRLARDGVEISPLRHHLGRGPVPAGLEADPASPLFLAQFRGPVKPEWRAALDATALAVYDYLPDHSYLVRLPPGAAEALLALPEVRAVEPYHPAWRIAPELSSYEGARRVTALGTLDAPLDALLGSLAATGALPLAWTTARLEHVVDLLATEAEVRAMARLDDVVWIEPAYDEGSLDNANASALAQGGDVGAWPLHARGVDGSTQKVSVCDTGANTEIARGIHASALGRTPVRMTHELHDDPSAPFLLPDSHELLSLHRKVDLYYAPVEGGYAWGDTDDAEGHGTHTAGTAAGDGAPHGERSGHDGVAFAAKLLVCDITIGLRLAILNDYSNYWDPAYARGARVSSNSWGAEHTSAYTEKARQHDAYVWEYRDFVIVRSMGNNATNVRPEAVAKSAIGVGATESGEGADRIAVFSGTGPAKDGRIKPNVVAPGACVTSSFLSGSASYYCMSGTSMSTPVVAGAAALVQDHFAKGFYPTGVANPADARAPSAALVRAILQISGREVAHDRGAGGFPNAVQGWGRVTLDDALDYDGDARGLRVIADEDASATTGSLFSATLDVLPGEPLRVMLAWSDAPGAAGADPALVNDLDLRVVAPDGTVLGAPDARNVEEAVYVDAPLPGTYTVRVIGSNVPMGPQPFALVATGAFTP